MDFKKDRLLTEFFNEDSNKKLYETFLENKREDIKRKLDERFKRHVFIARCIAYLSKLVHFESQTFDKKRRRNSDTHPLILDKPTETGSNLVDNIESPQSLFILESTKIEDYIQDPRLQVNAQLLTNNQKRVLYLVYIRNLKDTEVAKVMGVSQQSVTKTKKTALIKMREGVSLRAG